MICAARLQLQLHELFVCSLFITLPQKESGKRSLVAKSDEKSDRTVRKSEQKVTQNEKRWSTFFCRPPSATAWICVMISWTMVPCDRKCLHYRKLFCLELISALHYIVFTTKMFDWINFALHYIILTVTLRLHLVFVVYPTLHYTFRKGIHFAIRCVTVAVKDVLRTLKCNSFRSTGTGPLLASLVTSVQGKARFCRPSRLWNSVSWCAPERETPKGRNPTRRHTFLGNP